MRCNWHWFPSTWQCRVNRGVFLIFVYYQKNIKTLSVSVFLFDHRTKSRKIRKNNWTLFFLDVYSLFRRRSTACFSRKSRNFLGIRDFLLFFPKLALSQCLKTEVTWKSWSVKQKLINFSGQIWVKIGLNTSILRLLGKK